MAVLHRFYCTFSSDNAEVHMKAGQMYKEQGDLNSALKQTEIAIKLDTHFVVAVLNLADIYSQVWLISFERIHLYG